MIFGNHALWNGNLCTFSSWSLGILLYNMVDEYMYFYAWSLEIIFYECKLMYFLPLVYDNPALHDFLWMIFGNHTILFEMQMYVISSHGLWESCCMTLRVHVLSDLHVPRESCSMTWWVHVLFDSVVPWNPAPWHGKESRTCIFAYCSIIPGFPSLWPDCPCTYVLSHPWSQVLLLYDLTACTFSSDRWSLGFLLYDLIIHVLFIYDPWDSLSLT